MALGWLYLYSRYRKTQRRLREIEEQHHIDSEICNHCGYPRYQHAADARETCPIYITEEER